MPVVGVWDDHDFGLNDGGSDFARKDRYREMFLDFIQEPMESQRRRDKDNGIY